MDLEVAIYFLTIFVNLSLGTFVIVRDRKNRVNIFFGFFIYSITLWILTLFIYYHIEIYDIVQLVGRLNFAAVTLIGFFIYRFAHYYPVVYKKESKLFYYLITLSTFFFLIMTVFTTFVDQEEIIKGAERETHFGILYLPYFLHFILMCTIAVITLIKKIRSLEKNYKSQIWYFIVGFVGTTILASITNILLPYVFGIYKYQYFAPIFTVILVFLTTYSIIRHNLLNIRVVSIEILVAATWMTLAVQVTTAENLSKIILQSIIFIIFTFLSYWVIKNILKEEKLAEQQYEMVATVSHQLRTPLTPVLGYAAMMDQGDFDGQPAELKEAQHRLLISTQRLRNIINDFLQMFELEGEHKMDLTKTPLKDIVNEAMAGVKENYEQKKLYLKLENPADVNPILVGETKLLIQAINNLLDNAQRYTIEGGSTVQLSVEKNRAIIKVTDTGIGLDDNDKVRLFTKFYRSDAAKEVRPDGSGLGLPIVKTVVEAHGGKVHAESEGRGKGTTFIIELPLKKQ